MICCKLAGSGLSLFSRVTRIRPWLSIACPVVVCLAVASTPRVMAEAQQLADLRDMLDRGSYAEAERNAAALVTKIETTFGSESIEVARAQDVLVEALIRNGHAGQSSTLALAQRVVGLKEAVLGRDHLDTASSIHNLGAVYVERGEFGMAVQLHQRGLAIRIGQLPAGDPTVGDSLDLLTTALIKSEHFEEARRTAVQAQAIREARSGRAPLALARTLEIAGWLDRYSGNYIAAVPLVDRALAIMRSSAQNHPDLATAIELRGDLFWLTGDLRSASSTWTEAAAVGTRTLGNEHPIVGAIERRVAMADWAFGDPREARQLREHALRVADGSAAPCDPDRPKLLNDLGVSLKYDGEYSAAQEMFQRALTIYTKCFPRSSLIAQTVNNQAELAHVMGDLTKSERLHQIAVARYTAALGPNHPFVATAIDELAKVTAALGQRARAQALYERALAIRQRAYGHNHPNVAWTLTNLAKIQIDSGNLTVALRNLGQAAEIYKSTGPSYEPDHFARLLQLRAEIEARRGDSKAARATLAETLETRERAFGKSHPLSAATRVELASMDFVLGRTSDAFESALEAERDGRDHLRYTIRYLPERQAMLYAAAHVRGLDLALSILASGNVAKSLPAFDAVIQSRGVILDELAARARSAASSDPALAAISASLMASRERFANLMLRSLREDESGPRGSLDDAREKMETAERTLAERSATIRTEMARARAGTEDIRRALPPGFALVSFVRYDRSVLSVAQAGTAAHLTTIPSYLAFVARPESPTIISIPIGTAGSIEPLVAEWRNQVAGGAIGAGLRASEAERSYRLVGDRLRRRIWDPIAGYLADKTHVFIVPDGALNFVTFAALPTESQHYLGERYVLHYGSTERDLLRTGTASASRGLLAVGGPAFEGSARVMGSVNKPTAPTAPLRAGCADMRSVHFDALPGSQREAAQVGRIWSRAFSGESRDSVTLLTGQAATEGAVKSAVSKKRVIHFATHGFFLGSSCGPPTSGTRGIGGISTSGSLEPSNTMENPLVLSGLALAGANNRGSRKPGQDDGILTAEEIAGLNLQGTEWAVLSACDTGLGEIKASEGVFGLRRAFQIAGVGTVIMSMWAVDDRAAETWMAALYESRLVQHMSTADAVQGAALSVLHTLRARGLSTHPFYWAGFVAAGDWR